MCQDAESQWRADVRARTLREIPADMKDPESERYRELLRASDQELVRVALGLESALLARSRLSIARRYNPALNDRAILLECLSIILGGPRKGARPAACHAVWQLSRGLSLEPEL